MSEVIAQARSTVPLNPLSAAKLMVAEDASPGATAKGLKDPTVIEKSCPNAEGRSAKKAASVKKASPPRRFWDFILEFNDSDLNMSRFRFK